jgi:hypothetical protein
MTGSDDPSSECRRAQTASGTVVRRTLTGGPDCGPCADASQCSSSSDCESKVCDTAAATPTCSAATCSDGVMNADETDVDCGGSCTAKCANQLGCSQDSDCSSGFCHPSSECTASSCSDGFRNGSETDVDCGGPDCGPCADASQCSSSSDCESKVCDTAAATPTCSAATCSDGVMNADETDVDCGGCTAKCANQRRLRLQPVTAAVNDCLIVSDGR